MNSPTFLGPYRLGDLLGRGGMGSVYSGVHNKSGEKVAVKLISAEVADEMRFRRRFDAEIETLKRLRHDGIVRLIGYGEENGQLFYSMELVEGEPLQKRIRRLKRLDWMPTIDISIQICAALKHAHDIGVIHRDLKPANLLLTKDDTVKLVDFGIAKIFGFGDQTVAGSILGTADYMAPEQATDAGITSRTDLYALGSVMYAMLAGRAPFKGKRITQVIEALKRDKPVPLEMVVPEAPEALIELVHELLEKRPEDRPPTALAVMNRLKAMRAGLLHQQTILGGSDETAIKGAPNRDASQPSELKTGVPDSGVQNSGVQKSGVQKSGVLGVDSTHDGGANSMGSRPDAGTMHGALPPSIQHDEHTIAAPALDTFKEEKADVSTEPIERSTHFQTVGKSPSESGVFKHPEPESSNKFVQMLSIGVMCSILLLGALVALYALKKPSASELFDQINATAAGGNLSDARPMIDQFLKLYPDDDRYENVRSMDLSLSVAAALKRLQLKSKLPGRTLDAHEQAFVEAMQLRKQDTSVAEKRLQQWLDVFVDSTTHADDSKKELSELVEFEVKRLADEGHVVGSDKRTQELMARIRTGEELPVTERRKLLKGIVELYQDEAWAQSAVTVARDQLAELGNVPK